MLEDNMLLKNLLNKNSVVKSDSNKRKLHQSYWGMLAYSILKTQLDHLAHEVGQHVHGFTEVSCSYRDTVEFDNIAESCIFHLLLKPILTIDFRVQIQCFWNHNPYRFKSNCFWHCLPELS